MGGAGLLGVGIERVAYRPLRNANRLAPLITAIGVSLFLESAVQVWSARRRCFAQQRAGPSDRAPLRQPDDAADRPDAVRDRDRAHGRTRCVRVPHPVR